MDDTIQSLLGIIPEKWRGTFLAFVLLSPYLTRAYHALTSGGGVRGVVSAIWWGTNTPKPPITTPAEPAKPKENP